MQPTKVQSTLICSTQCGLSVDYLFAKKYLECIDWRVYLWKIKYFSAQHLLNTLILGFKRYVVFIYIIMCVLCQKIVDCASFVCEICVVCAFCLLRKLQFSITTHSSTFTKHLHHTCHLCSWALGVKGEWVLLSFKKYLSFIYFFGEKKSVWSVKINNTYQFDFFIVKYKCVYCLGVFVGLT